MAGASDAIVGSTNEVKAKKEKAATAKAVARYLRRIETQFFAVGSLGPARKKIVALITTRLAWTPAIWLKGGPRSCA